MKKFCHNNDGAAYRMEIDDDGFSELNPSENRIRFVDTRVFNFIPHEDITTYELALIVPIFLVPQYKMGEFIDHLPLGAGRHFSLITGHPKGHEEETA